MNAVVTITPVEKVDELYLRYPAEFEAQPVDLELDTRTGRLACAADPNIGGGTTFDHHHRLILSARIPALTAEAANTLMAQIEPLAQRVVNGADQEWNGNSHVGVFTADAIAAWDEIEEICAGTVGDAEAGYGGNIVTEWRVEDWFTEGAEVTRESLGITADTTNDQVAAIAAEQVETATTATSAYGILDHDAVAAFLTDLRDELRDEVIAALRETAEQLAEVKARRNTDISRIAAWQDNRYSSRAVGAVVGLSHRTVQLIAQANTAEASDLGTDQS